MEAKETLTASPDMARAREHLPGHSICLCRGDSILTHDGSGIAPMLDFRERGIRLSGYSAADRIIGKAAAMLFTAAGIREAYGEVVSEAGARYLKEHGIPVSWGILTDEIINRAGTGPCPMEETVRNLEDPEEGVKALEIRSRELAARRKG